MGVQAAPPSPWARPTVAGTPELSGKSPGEAAGRGSGRREGGRRRWEARRNFYPGLFFVLQLPRSGTASCRGRPEQGSPGFWRAARSPAVRTRALGPRGLRGWREAVSVASSVSFGRGGILCSWLGLASVSYLTRKVLEDKKHRQSVFFLLWGLINFSSLIVNNNGSFLF